MPLQDLLIVENHKYLTAPGDSDPEGRAVAFVDVIDIRPWLEKDIEAACAREWTRGYWAWELANVRPITQAVRVTAERRLYRAVLTPSVMPALLAAKDTT